ncbi:hypothetical protein [Streptomyces sp. NK15101]|uniref:hypothetical protein n=1 Tax=Streptomyces sp. NK15101 TaxID=2873261 RepID=UPI001CEC07C9|nr:hypothetical protein [Streptomyces sp. NK15101]
MPDPGTAWAFATGTDGTVRAASMTDGVRRPIGEGPAPEGGTGGRVAATCRIPGRIEVVTDTEEGLLRWTWWS